MVDNETYAYTVFSCNWNQEMASEFGDWYWGDFIEACMEAEEQAKRPIEVWTYELQYGMERVAPVQVTLGWDPHEILRKIFSAIGINPLFQKGDAGEINWLVYPCPNTPLNCQEQQPSNIPNPSDFHRFKQVLETTIALSKKQNQCLLFVGGQGFSYEHDEFWEEVAPVLKEAGMKFLDRHE